MPTLLRSLREHMSCWGVGVGGLLRSLLHRERILQSATVPDVVLFGLTHMRQTQTLGEPFLEEGGQRFHSRTQVGESMTEGALISPRWVTAGPAHAQVNSPPYCGDLTAACQRLERREEKDGKEKMETCDEQGRDTMAILWQADITGE